MNYLPDIRIESGGWGRTVVHCPYHPDWPKAARSRGGQWDAAQKSWAFDGRDADAVRRLLREIYGWDGTYPVDIADARVVLADDDDGPATGRRQREMWMFGRLIAHRPSRDSRVVLGKGVVLLSGGFPARGGSMNYPALSPFPATVVEVRDVPVHALEEAVGHLPKYVSEVPGSRRTVQAPGTVRTTRVIVVPEVAGP